jgi:hypothetical protein
MAPRKLIRRTVEEEWIEDPEASGLGDVGDDADAEDDDGETDDGDDALGARTGGRLGRCR